MGPFTIKVYGPPGTGKTRTLQRLVEWLIGVRYEKEEIRAELLEKGFPEDWLDENFGRYELHDIAFATFQTSALMEFVEGRLGMDMDEDRRPKAPLRYFRTIHGICQALLYDFDVWNPEISRRMGGKSPERWFQLFANQRRRIDPSFRFDPEAMGMANPFEKANVLWQTVSQVVNKEYHKVGREGITQKILEALPPALHEHYFAWEAFKEEKGIVDYNDMLMDGYDYLKSGVIHLPTKVLIVDEFQDLSPLQFEIFKLLAKDKELVVIAGDDWQTIFTWMGADPRFLIKYPADLEIVLRKTYRLPEKILREALSYAKANLRRSVFKDMVSTGKKGAFAHIRYFSTRREAHMDQLAKWVLAELKKGHSVMILTRTNSQALHFFGEFYKRGFKPRSLKKSTKWSKKVEGVGDFFDLLHSIIEFEKGNSSREVLLRVAWASGVDVALDDGEHNMLPLHAYLVQDWKSKIVLERIQEVWGRQARRFIEKILREGLRPMDGIPEEHELYIDTIHASKGREADVVFLINEMPRRNWRRFFRSEEELEAEARVWFVGMTRARKALGIVWTDKAFRLS
uniref:DNA 3'-5' helicase n=1 Tax=Pyrococcus sp. 12/1 TaxID=758582 RepID=D6MY07_9EURY|nr:ATP-dependent helicase [Pyrococcus sp. 12/1]ADF80208.1 p12-1p [Pyrococcus sp. 12/1]